MAEAWVVMLQEVRANRERAERARRLADRITTKNVAQRLLEYAMDLERLALEMEDRACALAETISATRALTAEVRSSIKEIRATVDARRRITKREE
jgi:hypothetical protein